MKTLIFSLFLLTQQMTYASGEQVDLTHFRFLGKGVQSRKTKDVIVVACVGQRDAVDQEGMPDCKELRHVIFKGNGQESYFLGPVYKVIEKDGVTEEVLLREALKEMGKEYKRIRHGRARTRAFKTGGGLALASIATVVIAPAGGFVVAPLIFLLGEGVALSTLFSGGLMTGHEKFINSIQDQAGWNWSEHSVKVNSTKFEDYLKSIQEP